MSIRGKLFRKSLSGVAVLGVAALALTACTTTGSTDTNTDTAGGGGTVTVAIVNDFTSFNNQTPQSNLDTNGIIGYLMGNYGSAFSYVDNEFNLVHEEEFGTFEKTSDDPQTVTYTLNPDNKWSDGEPVTADDMLLSWATQSGFFNSSTTDPDSGEVVTGTQYFDLAASTAGLDTTALPTISDDNLSMTLVYGTPYVDWEIINPIGQPAHIVAKKAGLGSAADLTELIMGLPKGDPASPAEADPTFKAAADFVNTGYDVTAFPTDPDLLVSSGPMVPTGWTPGQSFTMEPNKFYVAGMKPKIDKLILRVIPDANAEVTALQNGEVDIMYPQASADTLTALENTGADVLTGDQLSYDHVDLNFGSEVFADLSVRQAFLKTIPRQQILDSLITPINPDAEVLNSQIWVPANEPYSDSVSNNGSSDYAEVDIEGAKTLLAGATPTVSILYNSNNPNRVDTFQAIQESASQAGFNIVDKGSPDWSSLLSGGDYEASIFGWISPGVGSAGISQIFSTDGGGNYSRYTGTNDDALLTQITLDPDELIAIEKRMDKQMFADAYGLPLFQLPGVFGVSKRVSGVEYMGNQTGPFWNFWEWSVNE
ncbi:ABC transporter family substrate-binding protein [Cryobacterium ruanii]|uniref:ABC transporter family substrate-binding protein n=1 Tax=Cryobacterium ruanii TaxID=1259197 RepID=A0A4R9ASZ7_9MICO|nr:ABC transporter family substrate-binding protein [Cryobacterium ruanii]TFD68830.1 ABC transporter family substrate-binding protein [Cryobacterium ruanii]